jgi:hypothetical protein
MGLISVEKVAVEGVSEETRESSRAVVEAMREHVWARIAEGVVENEGGGLGGVLGGEFMVCILRIGENKVKTRWWL